MPGLGGAEPPLSAWIRRSAWPCGVVLDASRAPVRRAGLAGGKFKRRAGEAHQLGAGPASSIAGPEPGLEIVNPMAIVILGGLITTALLTLFVLPGLYARFASDPPELEPEEDVLYPLAEERAAGV